MVEIFANFAIFFEIREIKSSRNIPDYSRVRNRQDPLCFWPIKFVLGSKKGHYNCTRALVSNYDISSEPPSPSCRILYDRSQT